jgi:hypothetical protein
MDTGAYCADFQDADAYSYIDTENNEQCAWEFLRRNEKYAGDFKHHYDEQKIYENNLKLHPFLTRSDTPFIEGAYYIPDPFQGESLQQWMLRVEEKGIDHHIFSPARYYGYLWGLDQDIHDPFDALAPKFLKPLYPKMLQWPELLHLFAAEEEGFHQDTNILVVGLDLKSDFSKQKDALSSIFEAEKSNRLQEAEEYGGTNLHRKNWIQYLRVVDAKRKGVAISKMVDSLAPDIDNSYPNKSAEKRLQKQLKRGLEFVDKDYLKIVRTAT